MYTNKKLMKLKTVDTKRKLNPCPPWLMETSATTQQTKTKASKIAEDIGPGTSKCNDEVTIRNSTQGNFYKSSI